jgi:hypothetical protein
MLVDGVEEASGDLLTADFSPPLQPPEVIPDPDDIKPEDWAEEEMWVASGCLFLALHLCDTYHGITSTVTVTQRKTQHFVASNPAFRQVVWLPPPPPAPPPQPTTTTPASWVDWLVAFMSHARYSPPPQHRMDDPSAVKPQGWDDRRMVPDPSVTKPQGWLDKELPDIPDPTATNPDSWDEATQVFWRGCLGRWDNYPFAGSSSSRSNSGRGKLYCT